MTSAEGQRCSLTGSVISHLPFTPWLRGCPFTCLPLHQISCNAFTEAIATFSSVITGSFGQQNYFQLWFPNASGAIRCFPSSAPSSTSPLPLPFSVFLRFSSSFLFSFSNSSLGNLINFDGFFAISRMVATEYKFLFLTTSFFFVSGILRFHPSSLSRAQLPTFSG